MSSLKIITAITLTLILTVSAWCSIGAKPLGLSGAYSAYSEDINSIEWNPAGIAGISTIQMNMTYADLYGLSMIKQSNINIAVPINRTGLVTGLSFSNVAISYNYPSYFNLNDFKWDDSEFAWNISKMFRETFLIGTNIKYIRASSNITNGSANGYGFDLGFVYRATSDLSVGASFKNLYARKKWENGTSEVLARDYRAGVLYKIFSSRLKLSSDIFGNSGSGQTMDGINLGVEYVIFSDFVADKDSQNWMSPYMRGSETKEKASKYSFALRGGVTRLFYSDNRNKFSLGATADFSMVSIDYAYFNDNQNLGNTHFVSMGLNFGAPGWIKAAERRELLKAAEEAQAPRYQPNRYPEPSRTVSPPPAYTPYQAPASLPPPAYTPYQEPSTPPPAYQPPSAPPVSQSVPPREMVQSSYIPPKQESVICVLPFVNNSGIDRLSWLSESMMDMLNKEIAVAGTKTVRKNLVLRSMEGLNIRLAEELDAEQVKMIGLILNADKIIVGNFAEGVDSILNVYVRIYDTQTGGLIGYESVTGDMVNIFDMTKNLSSKITNY